MILKQTIKGNDRILDLSTATSQVIHGQSEEL